ncbi:hypothetical protein [Magnetospirillum fulvum]|uniref:hypothetical protein n=1 Tax=Magnetospirillum fulvum TaxID=1082 RepID=UPI001480337D|nr:hypothetical protein [Magnetospirillum fulvum]
MTPSPACNIIAADRLARFVVNRGLSRFDLCGYIPTEVGQRGLAARWHLTIQSE